jgi:hypothetical protein
MLGVFSLLPRRCVQDTLNRGECAKDCFVVARGVASGFFYLLAKFRQKNYFFLFLKTMIWEDFLSPEVREN